MNITELHPHDKAVSAIPVPFKGTEGRIIALQINAGEQLKEHSTPVPAWLICIKGHARFHTEQQATELLPGDYIPIEPLIKHRVEGITTSQLLLIK